MIRRPKILAFVLLLFCAPAAAQQSPPPAAVPRLELGPLTVSPRLDIKEIGVVDNVFNDPVDPQSDFVATIAPRVDLTLRMGWTRLTSTSTVDFVYFKDFEEERSINRGAEVRFEVGEGLLRPYILGSWLDTEERLSAEVDARANREQMVYGGGLGIAVTTRTLITTGVRRTTLEFAEGEQYRGVELGRTLNGRSDQFDAGVSIAVTPLTTWHVTAGFQRDEFDNDPRRNSESLRLTTGLAFSPSALISGTASAGYRRFTPETDTLAPYEGFVAQVSLGYAIESTRIEGTLERDVRYSYEDASPYYVTTGGRLVVTQQIAGPFDVQGTLGRQNLDYREYGGGEEASRKDWATTRGVGVGYRLGDTARIGVNMEWANRRSDELADRFYDRRRVYGTFTYGF